MDKIYRFFFDLGDNDFLPDFSKSIKALKTQSGTIFWKACDVFGEKEVLKHSDAILSQLIRDQEYVDLRKKYFFGVIESIYRHPEIKDEILESLDGSAPMPCELSEIFEEESLDPEEFYDLYESNIDLFRHMHISL